MQVQDELLPMIERLALNKNVPKKDAPKLFFDVVSQLN
jgi:hypothetical protein